METLSSSSVYLGEYTERLSCLIRLQGSCMDFIQSCTSLLGCRLCQMTGATQMCRGAEITSGKITYICTYKSIGTSQLQYILYNRYVCFLQNRSLLDSLQVLRSTRASGHILLYNTLAISQSQDIPWRAESFVTSVPQREFERFQTPGPCLYSLSLALHTEFLSSEWTIYGPANFLFFKMN